MGYDVVAFGMRGAVRFCKKPKGFKIKKSQFQDIACVKHEKLRILYSCKALFRRTIVTMPKIFCPFGGPEVHLVFSNDFWYLTVFIKIPLDSSLQYFIF